MSHAYCRTSLDSGDRGGIRGHTSPAQERILPLDQPVWQGRRSLRNVEVEKGMPSYPWNLLIEKANMLFFSLMINLTHLNNTGISLQVSGAMWKSSCLDSPEPTQSCKFLGQRWASWLGSTVHSLLEGMWIRELCLSCGLEVSCATLPTAISYRKLHRWEQVMGAVGDFPVPTSPPTTTWRPCLANKMLS